MLEKLRRIVQEVSTTSNLDEALDIIVRRVKSSMAVDACTVFLTNPNNGQHVLMATQGLNPESIRQVRLNKNEGLVGLVAERHGPVSLNNASESPRFRYFPITGEERYHAFLGVPLIHYGRTLGVLIVQQKTNRKFSRNDTAFLVTLAAQLAWAVNDAVVRGDICKCLSGIDKGRQGVFIEGISGAPGVAIGTVVLSSPFADLESVPDRKTEDPSIEEAAFKVAVDEVQNELRLSAERLEFLLPKEAYMLFDVYAMLLSDETLVSKIISRIRAGDWAAAALRDTIAEQVVAFEEMEDDYLRMRAEDIRALGQCILTYLQSDNRTSKQYPEQCVLVGKEVSLARIADVPVGKLAGIVCQKGSALSHTAIIAKALGVPAVMGIGELLVDDLEGSRIVVDGYQGRISIEPMQALLDEFQRLANEEEELTASLDGLRKFPAVTLDDVPVTLCVNTGLLSDITPSIESGADGVGLYRTEFQFMTRETFPGEDELYQTYRKMLQSFAPKPVTIRTLDAGGDKPLPYLSVEEDNPFLGWRGVRLTLDHPEIFMTQVRAMLRANAGIENMRLLLPMITTVNEIVQAGDLVEHACYSLGEEGHVVTKPPIGAMIEVPSAAFQITALAKYVDFFSIGTNDLAQYLLAVDRNNVQVAPLFDNLHPAVIYVVHEAVKQARHKGKPVSVCGEMAGDPAGAILLLGMGVENLSMAVSSLPRINWVIRNFTQLKARELLEEVLETTAADEVRRHINNALEKVGVGGLVRAGK